MKDNTSIGIDPNDDTAAIMAEIDKNIQEEQEAGTFGKDVDKKDYVDPRIDGLENLEDLQHANIADEEVESKEIPDNAKQLDDEVFDNAKEWLNNRPELIEGSKEYNPRIQKALATFIEEFDGELRRQGRAQDILSEDYLDVLDEFVDSIRVEKPKSGYKTSSVGAVRNNFSSNSGGGNTIQVKLESWEKDYAKNLGISERDYLKAKIEDIKETRRGR